MTTDCNDVKITHRTIVGTPYADRPKWQKSIAVPLIYLPIIFALPVMVVAAVIVRWHLTITGATNMRKFSDFLPAWNSHRYTYQTQITWLKWRWTRALTKLFWLFNCKMYCPFSVALIRYLAYLVQLVEIWWCPFNHGKKCDYAESAIDKSFWHTDKELEELLSPEDKENPIWNQDKS